MTFKVGYKQTPEHKAKIKVSAAKTYSERTPERLAEISERISNALVGRTAWNKGISTGVGHPAHNKKYSTEEERIAAKAEYQRKYQKERRANNPQARIDGRISALIRQALRENKAGKSWESLVGYTVKDLMDHLEKQFVSGMSWDNMGEWHIDHIKPRSSFSYDSPTDPDFRECWKLENLQPLWAIDNLKKGNKSL